MQVASSTPKYTLVYLAYALESTKYQAILSIYTLCHHVGPIAQQEFSFIIYTDKDTRLFDTYLKGLPVSCEVLSKAQVTQFRGPYDYVFRVKPHIIQHCFAKYQRSLLYLDTDTFFRRDPRPLLDRIAPGQALMNVEEHDFVDGGVEYLHWFYLRQALKRHRYVVRGQETQIPLHTMMWNAGIMGISRADAGLVEEIISLNDALYANNQTFIVEQFAASYILQKFARLSSTEDYIEHYWPKAIKNTYNAQLPDFLRQTAGLAGADLFDAAFRFAQEKSTVMTAFHESVLNRVLGRVKVIAKVARKGYL